MTGRLFDLPRAHLSVWDEPGLPWPSYAVCSCEMGRTHAREALDGDLSALQTTSGPEGHREGLTPERGDS